MCNNFRVCRLFLSGLILLIVMTITLFSCIQEEKTKDLRVIDLAGNVGKTSVVNLSEIAESIDYIPLETNDESLLAPPLTYLNFVKNQGLSYKEVKQEKEGRR